MVDDSGLVYIHDELSSEDAHYRRGRNVVIKEAIRPLICNTGRLKRHSEGISNETKLAKGLILLSQ